MSSIGSILSIARTAMQTQQLAMQTTGHNIANANTEGYSAQSVELSANTPLGFPYGYEGTGVAVQGITRARDVLLDQQYRTSNSNQGQYTTSSDILGRVESVFGEPSDTSLSSVMDAFWSSWSDLSASPTSDVARTAVKAKGQQLVQTFHDIDSHLTDTAASARDALRSGVTTVNGLLTDIGQLNTSIVSAESGNRDANDLRDERDRKLDQLSQYVSFQQVNRDDGSVALYLDGRMLVDRNTVHGITATGGSGPVTIGVQGDPTPIPNVGGSMGANADALTNSIPQLRAQLDALAGSLVREVNAVQNTGQAFSGNPPVGRPGGNFFTQNGAVGSGDPAQTAAGISLDASLSDVTNVVASSATATGPGDNTVASQLAALRNSPVTLYDASGTAIATQSLSDFYQSSMTDLGTSVDQANALATMHTAVTSQAQTRRDSVSGVATDEELVNLMKEQSAYAAAARLVTVVDQMTQSLLAIGT